MSETQPTQTAPPSLGRTETGEIDRGSLADLIEWFLMYDERTALVRHANTEELFQWKQKDDAANGVGIYPFPNAEARFAIGAVQALDENNSEPLLKLWISDVLAALQNAGETKNELTAAYDLDRDPEQFSIGKAEKLTTNAEKRLYLTSCWLEVLCTAEARVLGWIYQEIYGRSFAP